jgi:hypothetical protein
MTVVAAKATKGSATITQGPVVNSGNESPIA